MNATLARLGAALTFAIAAWGSFQQASADPLPGRDLLKFTQKPMIARRTRRLCPQRRPRGAVATAAGGVLRLSDGQS